MAREVTGKMGTNGQSNPERDRRGRWREQDAAENRGAATVLGPVASRARNRGEETHFFPNWIPFS